MQDFQEYYDILKVPKTATLADIKRAFRRLARQYHPDLNPDHPDAESIFKKVCEAYEVLQEQMYRERQGSGAWEAVESGSPIEAYVTGVQLMLDKEYLVAVNYFSEAIAHNPDFVPAYLKRVQVNMHLANYRAVLQDCQHILSLQPGMSEAHYYRGRARYRLGYIQSAIEAYNQAIALQSSYATAYYHRGIAYLDLKNQSQAAQDLHTAADWFQRLNDASGYQLAQTALKSIRWGGVGDWRSAVGSIVPTIGVTLRSIPWILTNPEKQLLATFQYLQRYRLAGGTGLAAAIAAVSLFTFGITLGWQPVVPLPWPRVALGGGLVFVSLVVVSAIARWAFDRRSSTFAGDLFIVGTALLPVGILPLIGALLLGTGMFSILAIALIALWYTGLLLYIGLIQVQSIPSGYAAMLAPLSLLLASGMIRLVWLFSMA